MTASFVAATFLNSLWESTVFAALAAALLGVLRPRSAAVRHRVWTVVLLKFAVPTEVLFALLQPVELVLRQVMEVPVVVRPALAAAARALVLVDPATAMPATWLGAGVALWLGGAMLTVFPTAIGLRRLAREMAGASDDAPARETRVLARAVRLTGCARPVRVHVSSTAATVMVAGWRRPVVVIPAPIAAALSDGELTAVLVHELTHVRRGDTAVSLATMVAVAVCWMHPAVWWLSRVVEREGEFACDDAAMATGESRDDFSRGLAKVVQAGFAGAPLGLSRAGAGDIAQRLHRIVTGRADRDGAWTSAAASAMLVVLLVALTAVANPCLR